MEARVDFAWGDRAIIARVDRLQEARYADGPLHGEVLELVLDVFTYPPIGVAVLLMGTTAVALTVRRRR